MFGLQGTNVIEPTLAVMEDEFEFEFDVSVTEFDAILEQSTAQEKSSEKSSATTLPLTASNNEQRPSKRLKSESATIHTRILPNWMAGTSSSDTDHSVKIKLGMPFSTVKIPKLFSAKKWEYCVTWQDCETICSRILFDRNWGFVGFDLEWKVTFQKGKTPRPAALIQLSNGKQHYLFQVSRFAKKSADFEESGKYTLPPSLQKILFNPAIKKVGVNVGGDVAKLASSFHFDDLLGMTKNGYIELSELGNRKLNVTRGKWSLSKLVHEILHVTLVKNSVRISDWERCPLACDQQMYAASDAYAAISVFNELNKLPDLPGISVAKISPTFSSPDRGPYMVGTVKQVSKPGRLPPSVFEVYSALTNGCAIVDIAEKRGIKRSTVESYIAKAMFHGYAYDLENLKIPERFVATVKAVFKAHFPNDKYTHEFIPNIKPLMKYLEDAKSESSSETQKQKQSQAQSLPSYRDLRFLVVHAIRMQNEEENEVISNLV